MIVQADAWQLPFKTESIDCIITSPPYFGCENYKTPEKHMPMLGVQREVEAYVRLLSSCLSDCIRVLKPTGVMCLIIGDNDNQVPIPMAPQRLAIEMQGHGWEVLQEIHWVKKYRVPGRTRFMGHPESKTEKIYIMSKSFAYTYNDNGIGNVWDVSPARYTAGDWAVLPDKIVENCLTLTTEEGDIVLDPFCGSGVVPRIASDFGRIGIGSDINPA